ncbi:TPA: hypothetical protein ACH7I0_005033, partial [Escherichia coli]
RNVHLHTRHDDGRGTRGTVEGVQHPAITRKDKRGNKTVFKTLLKTILTAFMGCGAAMPHP